MADDEVPTPHEKGDRQRTVGFIGLGSMGSAMVGRLLDEGYDVVVWNRSKDAVNRLADRGARPANEVADVFRTGLVFSILAHDNAFRAIFSPAVLSSAPADCLHVNMATISVAAAAEFAEQHLQAGVQYLAAPVLGRPPVAAAGQLNIVVGGSADLLERARGPLGALSKRIWRLGDTPMTANIAKIAVNYTIIHALQAMSESITLVERSGIDPGSFAELLSSTLFPGPVYTGYGAMIAESRYSPAGFTTELGLKDLTLAQQAADGAEVALPSAATLFEVFAEAMATGGAELDWASIAEITRRRSAVVPPGAS